MRTLKLVVAYDGTPFVGWQRQAEGVSIQSLLEDALGRIEGQPVTVVGAGRTDAGVHALAQVASCSLAHSIAVAELRRALNAMLPVEIRVTSVEAVDENFHARYAARGKTYRYAICNADTVSPFLHRYAWHVDLPLSASDMAAAARLLEGTHDFAVFQSAGGSAKTTTRTIFASRIIEVPEHDRRESRPGRPSVDCDEECPVRPAPRDRDVNSGSFGGILSAGAPGARLLVYEVSGDGFLRHMVRAIVGSLVEVGCGRRSPGWFGELLRAGSRAAAGPTAPAHGLWLVQVDY